MCLITRVAQVITALRSIQLLFITMVATGLIMYIRAAIMHRLHVTIRGHVTTRRPMATIGNGATAPATGQAKAPALVKIGGGGADSAVDNGGDLF